MGIYFGELARKNAGVVKKLRIAVPHKPGFKVFVNITHPNTERQKVTGYSIEIFEEAMKMLQPRPDYEFYAFNGSYDELVRNVSLKVSLTSTCLVRIIYKAGFTMFKFLVQLFLFLLFISCGINRCLMQQLVM